MPDSVVGAPPLTYRLGVATPPMCRAQDRTRVWDGIVIREGTGEEGINKSKDRVIGAWAKGSGGTCRW